MFYPLSINLPVGGLVVVVVVVLVGRLAELLSPEGHPDRHVAVQAQGHEGHRGQPPVVEVHVKDNHLFFVKTRKEGKKKKKGNERTSSNGMELC